jgi:ADP-ribosylglycohydrolase
MEPITEKIKATFWGQAIGDALGLGTEFMTTEQIKTYYGSKPFTFSDIISDVHRDNWKKGDWSDDTDQMLVIVDTLLNDENINKVSLSFAHNLYNWYVNGVIELGDKGGVGIGTPVRWVLQEKEFLSNPKAAAREIWNDSPYTENGCIMRTGILGTMNKPLDEVVELTSEFCLVTHADPRCVAACVYLVVCIYYFVRSDLHAIEINEVMDLAQKEAIKVMRRLDNNNEEYENKFLALLQPISKIEDLKLDTPSIRSTIKQTFRCVVYALHSLKNRGSDPQALDGFLKNRGETFEKIMWDVILQGGDADTNAAVVCTMLGSYFGDVPNEIKEQLLYKDYMNDKINEWISSARKLPKGILSI